MANIKSAKKRVLIAIKKHDRNRIARSAVKTHVTRVRRLVDSGETTPVAEVSAAVKALDQAAERGILHRNNAARRKSRLMRMVAKASALAANPEAAARAAAEAKAHAKGTAKSKTKAGKKAAAAKSAAARSTVRK